MAAEAATSAAPATARRAGIRIVDWGTVEYEESLERQRGLWARRVSGAIEDIIVFVEHAPVITLGRHAPEDDILLDREALGHEGISLVRSDRGGRATYHGPGQAVIYPIVAIAERGIGVKQWVAMLEAALLETLRAFHVRGRRHEGRPGIWVGDAKIGSIGLRVSRGVSYHGVSINVESRSTSGFRHIVTCGVAGQRVTSIAKLRGADNADEPRAFWPSVPHTSVSDVSTRFCEFVIRRLADVSTRTE
jgi:lipoate-protein ligase B